MIRRLKGLPPKEKPERCEQHRGRRTHFELDGERHSLREWSEIYGIKLCTLISRLYNDGMDLRTALTTPVAERSQSRMGTGMRICVDGETLTIREWADRLGIQVNSLKTIIGRKRKTMSPEEVIRERLQAREETRRRTRDFCYIERQQGNAVK